MKFPNNAIRISLKYYIFFYPIFAFRIVYQVIGVVHFFPAGNMCIRIWESTRISPIYWLYLKFSNENLLYRSWLPTLMQYSCNVNFALWIIPYKENIALRHHVIIKIKILYSTTGSTSTDMYFFPETKMRLKVLITDMRNTGTVEWSWIQRV